MARYLVRGPLTYELALKDSPIRQFFDDRLTPGLRDVQAAYRKAAGPLQVPGVPREAADPGTIGTAADWLMRFLVHPNPSLHLAAQGTALNGMLPVLKEQPPPVPGTLAAATDPPGEPAARQRRAAIEAAVLGNRLRRSGRLDLAAYTALLLLRTTWCHTLSSGTDAVAARSPAAAAAIRMFAGYAAELLDQAAPVAKDPRALLNAVTPTAFAHVSYPVACARLAEILGLLGLLADGAGPDVTATLHLNPDRIAHTVQDLLEHQPGCAHPVSDAYAVSLIAPALLTARHAPDTARRYLTSTAVRVADRYDPDHGGIGLAASAADPATEVAYLLGAPYEHGPAPRPGSYLATVITDLTAIIPGCADLYMDMVNEFLAVGADPWLLQADERRAQWRPGTGATLTPNIIYAEPLPSAGIAAAHHRAEPPPVPPWDALALTSITRDRHTLATLRASLRT